MKNVEKTIDNIRENKRAYVYKIIYPNGKIYIGVDYGGGKDDTSTMGYLRYFGSPSLASRLLMDEEHSGLLQVGAKIIVTKEILWVGTLKDAFRTERELIKQHNSTNPEIGYNLR